MRFPCGANLVSLKNIISHILQKHDFDVYETDEILYGQNDGDLVTVGIYEKVTVNDIREHASKIADKDGRHIICVLEAGDAAVEDAMALTKHASKVYLTHRRDELRASKVMVKRVMESEKVEIIE